MQQHTETEQPTTAEHQWLRPTTLTGGLWW